MAMKIDCSVAKKVTMVVTLENFILCLEDGCSLCCNFWIGRKRRMSGTVRIKVNIVNPSLKQKETTFWSHPVFSFVSNFLHFAKNIWKRIFCYKFFVFWKTFVKVVTTACNMAMCLGFSTSICWILSNLTKAWFTLGIRAEKTWGQLGALLACCLAPSY
jgi:hypothetical protein